MPTVLLSGRRFWLLAGIAIGIALSLRVRHHLRQGGERARDAYRRVGPAVQYERRREELRDALAAGRREMSTREAEIRAEIDPPWRT